MLTGVPAAEHELPPALAPEEEDALLEAVALALAAGRGVTFVTRPSDALGSAGAWLAGSHAYAVMAVDRDARTLDLANPWGRRHPPAVSAAEVAGYFERWWTAADRSAR
jgi:hypothetical protein